MPIYEPNDTVFRQPAVEPFGNDGFCAHAFAPVGESLIGWWKTKEQAERALLDYYRDYLVVQVSEHDHTIVAMYKASEGMGPTHSAIESWNKHVPRWRSKLDNMVFAGGFNGWPGIVGQ